MGGCVPALLSVDGLSVAFAPLHRGTPSRAVRDATFEIGRGRIVGLVGESGSGKTATALAPMGLHDGEVTTIGGRAEFDGIDLLSQREDVWRKIRGARHRHGLPGADDRADPALRIGRQMPEVLAAHTERRPPRRRASGRRSARRRRHPHPRAAPELSRTSSPAACASAR